MPNTPAQSLTYTLAVSFAVAPVGGIDGMHAHEARILQIAGVSYCDGGSDGKVRDLDLDYPDAASAAAGFVALAAQYASLHLTFLQVQANS